MTKIKNKKNLLFIIEIIFLILMIYSIIHILLWYKSNRENNQIINNISEDIAINEDINETEKYEINFKELKEKNSDMIAWLKVENTNIEIPVVQGKDNSYYLTHNFNKTYNSAGWVFADYKNKLNGTDKNIVIYGHNVRDDSMFGSLKNVITEEWYNNEENLKITFVTENEYQEYQVFSVYQIKAEDYYIQTEFKDNEFLSFIDTITKRSKKDFCITVSEKDTILTLSTCANNNKYRVVLHGVRIKNYL